MIRPKIEQSNDLDIVRRIAQDVLGAPVLELARAGGGANADVYRLESPSGRLALKRYRGGRISAEDRATNEFAALRFLGGAGLAEVPEPIAGSAAHGVLIMKWIDGVSVDRPHEGDFAEANAFLGAIFRLSAQSTDPPFGLASEACLSGVEIDRQIASRRNALVGCAVLASLFREHFDPVYDRARAVAARAPGFAEPISARQRRLVPADFGFHNALRGRDGRLRFFDFDYFGWDDPVKLAADFVLHPAMDLNEGEGKAFVRRMRAHLTEDAEFERRFAVCYPLYALRWALIVLNMFRVGMVGSAEARAERQMDLASRLIDRASRALSS